MADFPTNKDNVPDEENGSTLKDKKAKAMMYVQQIKHLPITNLMNQSREDQLETLEKFAEQAKAVRYALIIHDKDLDDNGMPKEPHVHLMLEFEQSIRLSTVASRLNDKPNYLETYSRKGTKSDIQNGFAYLTHLTNNAKDKYQYDIEEVRANFDYKAYIESLEFGISISSLLNTLREGKITALKAKQIIATQAGAITFAKFEPKIMKIEELRQEEEFQRWQTKMIADNIPKKVFWLSGISGVGKSLIAGIIADNIETTYFKTGGSNDMFQGYDGEHTIIIDELRPENINYSDLLKITDPFNFDSTTVARYKNAKLQAELIIITSPNSPKEFYNGYSKTNKKIDKLVDSFGQLNRRLSLILEITKDHLIELDYDEKYGSYIQKKFRENVYLRDTITNIINLDDVLENLDNKKSLGQ